MNQRLRVLVLVVVGAAALAALLIWLWSPIDQLLEPGSTDNTQPTEHVGTEPFVCDGGVGDRTGGVLAGHSWEARVGLVADQVTVRVDRHTVSAVEAKLLDPDGAAMHLLAQGDLMVVTAHVPFGWRAELTAPEGHVQILCRFATGPEGSWLVAGAMPLMELREAVIVNEDHKRMYWVEDDVLEGIANGQIGGAGISFAG